MKIQSEHIVMDELKIEDAFFFPQWGKHKNPLFYDYNYHDYGIKNFRNWFLTRNSMFQHYYGIYLQERFIGFLGMKKIKPVMKTSLLGFVMDPNFAYQGYGREALEVFLEDYFYHRKMRWMYLEVTKHNLHAIRLYTNIGFEIYGQSQSKIILMKKDYSHPEVEKAQQFLFQDNLGQWWEETWKMKINMEAYKKRG